MAWRDSILNNLGLKLFSLFLAVLIWFSARFYAPHDPRPPSDARQPVATNQVLHLPIRVLQPIGAAGKFIVEPAEAQVTFSGERTLIKNLAAADIHVFVSLVEAPASVTNKAVEVFLPRGLTLLKVTPALVHIQCLPP